MDSLENPVSVEDGANLLKGEFCFPCWRNESQSSDSEDLNSNTANVLDVSSWIDSSVLPEMSVGVKRTLDVLDQLDQAPTSQQKRKKRKVSTVEKDPIARMTGVHTPSINRPKDGKDHRKRCRVCKTRKTDLICFECNAALCVSGYDMQNCWYIYHNCEIISKPLPPVESS